MKKRIIAVLLSLLLSLTACGGKDSDKTEITMYLWDKSMTEELTPWLEEQFPDIDFTFVIGYNTMDYYTDLDARDNLPDIITCRRFSLNDAAHMSDLLMDLSETDVVGSYFDTYIQNNRESNGDIHWLPMCAEVDGYIANADLFAKYEIALPTNYEEFVQACRKFEQLGLKGYINDYREDYSCMEALQGCAIPDLMTMDGTKWRSEYESETDDKQVGLDKKVWPVAFQKLEQYLKDTAAEPADVKMSFHEMIEAFLAGETAIMRGTASNCVSLRQESGKNIVMLPYFGETSEDNWLLTYPTCQVAVNKKVEQDFKKTEAVTRILEAMFSEEGQRKTSVNNAVLSYNKNVNIEINDVFSQVTDCINGNRMYMRLASTEMFAISKNVVQKMIQGEYGAEEAYKDFNTQLTAGKDVETSEIVTTQKTAYDYALGEKGSPAASAVTNTIRKQWASDIAIGYSSVVSAPVFEGDYTRQQLNWLLANRLAIRHGSLTGSEVKEMMEWLVNVKKDGSNPIRHKNLIPVTSGMEYQLIYKGNGQYSLGKLSINGQPIEDDVVYSVMIFGDEDYIQSPLYGNSPMPQELSSKMEATDKNIYTLFNTALEGGNQLETPTEYVAIM